MARPPTLMKTCPAVSSRSPTRTVRGPLKRPWPRMTVTPGVVSSHFVTPAFASPEIWSLRSFTRFMSTRSSPPICTPNWAALRAVQAARALATIALVGMQPVLTQVPPKRARSRMATLRPALASLTASEGPAWPVPITIASNGSIGTSSAPC
jgi:hypothetical protein